MTFRLFPRVLAAGASVAWLLFPLLLLLPTGRMKAQGFSSMLFAKKKVVLERKLPPTVHLTATAFKVTVDVHKGVTEDVGTDLKTTLESILLRNDARLRNDPEAPQVIIACTVTDFAIPPPTVTHGTAPAIGKKGSPPQQTTSTRVTGLLTVAFQVHEAPSKRSLTADTVAAKYDRQFTTDAAGNAQGTLKNWGGLRSSFDKAVHGASAEDTPPTPPELHQQLVDDAASQIASHLVQTDEKIEVYLASGGELSKADAYAEHHEWQRYYEFLSEMTPLSDPQKDAYRIYDLGVAREALAYEAESPETIKRNLNDASVDYGKAIAAKPEEKYFLEPQSRITTALAHFRTAQDQRREEQASTEAEAKPVSVAEKTPAPPPTPPNDPSDGSLTNQQVIDMVDAHMDETNILDNIRSAKIVKFDLSPAGQIDLTKHGVSGRVLTAMKLKARGGPVHHTAATRGK